MEKILNLLLLAAFFNAISWILIIPLWQYPDEQAHFAQVQFTSEVGNVIYNNSAFDTSREVALSEDILGTARDELGNNKFTYHPEAKLTYQESLYGQKEHELSSLPKTARSEFVKREATVNPPLYYNLAALVYKLFSWGDLFTRVYAIRLMSAIVFLLTIYLVFKTGQLIFKKEIIMPLSLASIVAFKPMLVFTTTGVLPDALTILLFSSFIFFSLKIIIEGLSPIKIVLILITIILGATTRQNFLTTLFILPVVFTYQLIFFKKSRIKIVMFIIFFGTLLFIASFFVPSLDFIHRLDYPESSRKIPNNPLSDLRYLDHLNWTFKHTVAEVWPWYWGVYKWLSLTMPPIIYQIINRLAPLAFIGLILKIIIILRQRSLKESFHIIFLVSIIIIYFLLITTFDYFYRKNNGFSFGIQGRYFFLPIVAQMILLLVGFWEFSKVVLKNYAKYAIFFLVSAFVIFNLVSLFYVASSYYDLSNFDIFIKHASQYKPLFLKGDVLYLILTTSVLLQSAFLFQLGRYTIKVK